MEADLRTRKTLLAKIRDTENHSAWEEFVDLYTPLLYRFALSRGLRSPDAADLVQDVMRSISKSIERFEYRPEKAPFRAWLYRLTRNQIANFYRAEGRRPQGDGRTTMMRIADEQTSADESEAHWDEQYYRQLLDWAEGKVRDEFNPRIWTAFRRTAIDGEAADEVAADLGMTRAGVYVAKCRCIARLREKISSISGERWEIDAIAGSAEKNSC